MGATITGAIVASRVCAMRCVICDQKVRTDIDGHLGSHVSVSQNEIVEYFKIIVAPYEVRLHQVTCTDVTKGKILFGVENATLLIAFAEKFHQIPWGECCEWMALHEKGHIQLRELYCPPDVNANIISNVEDFYIEEYMIPRKYRRVYEAHVKLIVAIRKMTSLSQMAALRDLDARICYYLTFASWYGSNVITLNDMDVAAHEAEFIEATAKIMREAQRLEELPGTVSQINGLCQDFC